MKTLKSHVQGEWFEAAGGFAALIDPCSEEPIAQVSSEGVDFGKALAFARSIGGEALRKMSIGERGSMLLAFSKALQDARDELISVSILNTGCTRKDAKFDIDGGIFTLSFYGQLGESIGDRKYFVDGDGIQLGRSARFWGQHLQLPLEGAAVLINAFNFPVWGFAEKAACALLAGMPVITKPATSSALVAHRAVEPVLDAGILPKGAFSFICGATGDLLDRLGPQDVLSFTGSASTALSLRGKANLLANSTRVNVEADSLNSAIVGPDVEPGSETWDAFVRDVAREITQKTGQKCTAVRRIFVPAARIDEAQAALIEQLGEIVVGNPQDSGVRMGPLATRRQLDDAIAGVLKLSDDAERVLGTGERIDGQANPPGKGYFFPATLLRAGDGHSARAIHEHEVFGPVATLVPYDGTAEDAAKLVGLGQGSLVTSLYSDDRAFVGRYVERGGASTGRLYIGSAKVASQLPGSGVAMPELLHGGPGRAGGGEELGGSRGLDLYLQRLAVSGDRALIERLAGLRD